MNITTNTSLTLPITELSDKALTNAGVLTRDLDTLFDFVGSFGPYSIDYEHDFIENLDGTSRVVATVCVRSDALGPVRNAYFSEAIVMMVLKAAERKKKIPNVKQVP